MAANRGRTGKGEQTNQGGNYRVYKMDDAAVLSAVRGVADANLRRIEVELKVSCQVRGAKIHVTAKSKEQLDRASDAFNTLRQVARRGADVNIDSVLAGGPARAKGDKGHPGPQRAGAAPRTEGQRRYAEAMEAHDLVFGVGPAGTGKTFMAVAAALRALVSGHVRRIVLTRPAVEAGEHLGFLPGGLAEKVDPYLRPLYDAMGELVGDARVDRMRKDGQIEVAPLAFMRGRTLAGCFVLLDEAQNCTRKQIAMLLTRLGQGSKCVVTGDRRQCDIRDASGLAYAVEALKGVEGVAICEMQVLDVVRHPLVARIVTALDAFDESQGFRS